jgi:hypothetical protein
VVKTSIFRNKKADVLTWATANNRIKESNGAVKLEIQSSAGLSGEQWRTFLKINHGGSKTCTSLIVMK